MVDETSEYQRAATGYFVWPLAVFDLLREAPETSRWARLHARQAIVYGIVAMTGYTMLLAAPLVLVLSMSWLPTPAIVAIYGAGALADAIIALILLGMTVRYSGLAARGELFAIPGIAGLAERVFGRVG